MKILAHRGYWKKVSEKNSEKSLKKALKKGYGFESDIRDYDGKIVISHDLANKKCTIAETIFKEFSKYNNELCFAVNIKSDGLVGELLKILKKNCITNYFCFDMSIPQMINYCEKGLNIFTRQSEYEIEPLCLYDKSQGVWIDAFYDDSWITEELILKHVKNGKKICLVSPELHSLPYLKFWEKLKSFKIDYSEIMLCTDLPDEANNFFNREMVKNDKSYYF
jgi:hypothetical protein